jgi:hypothetical protein
MENWQNCGNFTTTRLNTGGWFNGMCRTDMNVLYILMRFIFVLPRALGSLILGGESLCLYKNHFE